MPIALQNPIAQAPITNVTVVDFRVHFGPAQTFDYITYAPSDANDNPIPGAPTTTVQLAPADVLVFFQTAGGFKARCLAALISNQPQLGGVST